MTGWAEAAVAVAIVVATVAAMEVVAILAHRHVMHGFGWGWHRSHHQPTDGPFEANDLYAVVFAALSVALFVAGSTAWPPLFWVATGMTVYGALYFIVHDGLVHRRWPFRHVPRRGYLKRLVQAHRLHHAVEERDGCVSFGFLWAPPVPVLKERLRRERARLAAERRALSRDGAAAPDRAA